MLLKSEKVDIVKSIKQEAETALDAAIANYRGVDVASMTKLRQNARDKNVYLKVTRNTLIKRAIADTDYACLEVELSQPTLLGFSRGEPGAVARLFRDFTKENPTFQVKGLAVSGEFLSADKISVLANLPTREEALAQVAAVLQAPVQKFAVTLNQIPTSLVRSLSAVSSTK
ncbi:MAG: 50S ribosomal protein L10 [Candidatus Portiera sp.]|nr:50S ribosomal protein L10 [Portiera sp.]